jgi:flagellar hook-associated protein 1 FlgK
MGDALTTGVSGLLAIQRALDVTSNNIANANTPGYSVERANLQELPAQPTGAGYVGSGVTVASITRSYDEALADQVRTSQSSLSSSNAFATAAGQVDDLLSASGTGLASTLQSFVNAIQGVANAPSGTAQRQVLLSQAQALAQQLKSYDGQISQYRGGLEAQLGANVTQINSVASGIASLNTQIASAIASGQTPNDLLDKRDQLLDQLSQYVGISTTPQSDGEVNVFFGAGQPLITGGSTQTLTLIQDPYDATRHEIALQGPSGAADITSQVTGGALGGLLAVRSQVLDTAQNALGQISVGIATLVNQQQAAGMDLTGAPGSPLFAVGGVQVSPSTRNGSNVTASATISSLGALTSEDYKLTFKAGSWQLSDATTGQAVSISGSGTAGSPFQAAGLSIVISGVPANGDTILVRPTAAATQGLSVLISNPAQIAAAAPIQAAAAAANTGTASISPGTVVDPTNPQLLSSATITFVSPTTYQINGAGSFAYTPEAAISANGWSVNISGTPASGDTFTVSRNLNGSGDNRNALAMAGLLGSASLNGGTLSLNDAANNLVGQVGVVTQQAQSSATVQQSLNQNAVTARSNVSGVNLDEEAANLLRYQQAYQACAQLISASNTMFNSLIAAFRG